MSKTRSLAPEHSAGITSAGGELEEATETAASKTVTEGGAEPAPTGTENKRGMPGPTEMSSPLAEGPEAGGSICQTVEAFLAPKAAFALANRFAESPSVVYRCSLGHEAPRGQTFLEAGSCKKQMKAIFLEVAGAGEPFPAPFPRSLWAGRGRRRRRKNGLRLVRRQNRKITV